MDKDRLEIAVDWANEWLGLPGDKDLFSTVAKVVLELVEENDTLRKGMEAFLNKTDYHREALKNEAAVRNENKVLSLKLEQAEADNAALVHELREIETEQRLFSDAKKTGYRFSAHDLYCALDRIFSRSLIANIPHPGQALLDELTKLRAVALASRTDRMACVIPDCECARCRALAELDNEDED